MESVDTIDFAEADGRHTLRIGAGVDITVADVVNTGLELCRCATSLTSSTRP